MIFCTAAVNVQRVHVQAMGLAIPAGRFLCGLFQLTDLAELLACFRRGMGAISCDRTPIPCIFVCCLLCVDSRMRSILSTVVRTHTKLQRVLRTDLDDAFTSFISIRAFKVVRICKLQIGLRWGDNLVSVSTTDGCS